MEKLQQQQKQQRTEEAQQKLQKWMVGRRREQQQQFRQQRQQLREAERSPFQVNNELMRTVSAKRLKIKINQKTYLNKNCVLYCYDINQKHTIYSTILYRILYKILHYIVQ